MPSMLKKNDAKQSWMPGTSHIDLKMTARSSPGDGETPPGPLDDFHTSAGEAGKNEDAPDSQPFLEPQLHEVPFKERFVSRQALAIREDACKESDTRHVQAGEAKNPKISAAYRAPYDDLLATSEQPTHQRDADEKD